jgi:hypothetical protein
MAARKKTKAGRPAARPARAPRKQKTLSVGGDAVVRAADAADELPGVNKRYLYEELASGRLKGRLIGGSVGWITTRGALLAWATGEGGPRPEVVDAPPALLPSPLVREARASIALDGETQSDESETPDEAGESRLTAQG